MRIKAIPLLKHAIVIYACSKNKITKQLLEVTAVFRNTIKHSINTQK